MNENARNLPKPVGVWIRVSTEAQAQGDSPETHEHRALGYATAKDWQVVETYRLAGVSGKAVRSHPECQRMLDDIRSGKIQALIFSKIARLARNTRNLLDLADFFREQKADLVSLEENFDTGTHGGRFFFTMLAAMAEWEREEISSRVKEAVVTKAKMGKPIGGPAPYGYTWENKQLVLNPDEAPIRSLTYDLFLKIERIATVAKELNQRGYKTRRGGQWSENSVRGLITDSISKGLWRRNHRVKNAKTGRWESKPEEEWVFVQVPAIVSEETWNRANAILDARAADRKRRPGRQSKHLFTGVLTCSCGKKMYVPSRTKSYRCRSCKVRIEASDLEAIFLQQLRQWLTPETVAAILLQTDSQVQQQRDLVETLSRQIEQTKADIDQLFALNKTGEIPTEGFRHRYQPLAERLSQLQVEHASRQGALDCFQTELMSEEQALTEAQQLLDNLEALDLETKRDAVQTLVERIDFDGEEVVLRLKYQPFLSLETPKSLGDLHRFAAPSPQRPSGGLCGEGNACGLACGGWGLGVPCVRRRGGCRVVDAR